MKNLILHIIYLSVFSLNINATSSKIGGCVFIEGKAKEIKLIEPLGLNGLKVLNTSWVKSDEAYTIIASMEQNLTSEWKTFSFSFTPTKSGILTLRLKGLAWKPAKSSPIIDYDDLKITGSVIQNSGFEEAWVNKGTAKTWWAKFKPFCAIDKKDAKEGKNYISIPVKKSVSQGISVIANQKVRIEFSTRINPNNKIAI